MDSKAWFKNAKFGHDGSLGAVLIARRRMERAQDASHR